MNMFRASLYSIIVSLIYCSSPKIYMSLVTKVFIHGEGYSMLTYIQVCYDDC